MFEPLIINSYQGHYTAFFKEHAFESIFEIEKNNNLHFIIDGKVAKIYQKELIKILASNSVLSIRAKESSKSFEKFDKYINHFIHKEIKKTDIIVAIGGGIIQDIACFLASVILRGIEWHFYPTTLLSQADSCIGSKSSINVGGFKNLLGTFKPPNTIIIDINVLKTLNEKDMCSGIGEMLKVHVIDGQKSFNMIADDYDSILFNSKIMAKYIYRALEIKKRFIEQDEFDKGIRNILNYGHSFGHSIESATNFLIPHGIAVSIGMDLANFISAKKGFSNLEMYNYMHPKLQKNFNEFKKVKISLKKFLSAINKDKKNVDNDLSLILPDKNWKLVKVKCKNDQVFQKECSNYLNVEISS